VEGNWLFAVDGAIKQFVDSVLVLTVLTALQHLINNESDTNDDYKGGGE
jgi:hypothetical protein